MAHKAIACQPCQQVCQVGAVKHVSLDQRVARVVGQLWGVWVCGWGFTHG